MFVVTDGELLRFFVRSFLLGCLFACAYLICGFFRLSAAKTIKKRIPATVLVALIDLLFFSSAAFFEVLMVFAANRGQVRILAQVFQALGFLLIWFPLRKPVYKGQETVLRFLVSITSPVRARIRLSRNKRRIRKAVRRFPLQTDRLAAGVLAEFYSQICQDPAGIGKRSRGTRDRNAKQDIKGTTGRLIERQSGRMKG